MATFLNYGKVSCQRQGEIIKGLATPQQAMQSGVNELAKAIAQEMRNSGLELLVNDQRLFRCKRFSSLAISNKAL